MNRTVQSDRIVQHVWFSVCCSDETNKMTKTDKRTSSNEPKPVRASMPPSESSQYVVIYICVKWYIAEASNALAQTTNV